MWSNARMFRLIYLEGELRAKDVQISGLNWEA